jgi:hypothetical protein
MPGIEIKGRSKIANYRHGGRTGKFGGGRTNLLEQLGRVEAEPSNRNRRAEISRVHGELNRGYAKGGRAGYAIGSVAKAGKMIARKFRKPKPHRDKPPSKTHKDVPTIAAEGGRIGLRHGTPQHENVKKWISRPGKRRKMGKRSRGGRPTHLNPKWEETKIPSRLDSQRKNIRLRAERKKVKYRDPNTAKPEWSLNKWGLKEGGKADKKWIQKAVDPKHKGYCTPMTKKTCTPARKALARTFKKKAKTGWG